MFANQLGDERRPLRAVLIFRGTQFERAATNLCTVIGVLFSGRRTGSSRGCAHSSIARASFSNPLESADLIRPHPRLGSTASHHFATFARCGEELSMRVAQSLLSVLFNFSAPMPSSPALSSCTQSGRMDRAKLFSRRASVNLDLCDKNYNLAARRPVAAISIPLPPHSAQLHF